MRLLTLPPALAVAVLGLMALVPTAAASPYARFGLQDDAWIAYGPGSLEKRLDRLEGLGVEVVRFNLEWNRIAVRKPVRASDPDDPAYRWGAADPVLRGLRDHGIAALVAIHGTPRWANGGRSQNWAPRSKWAFRAFALAAARRYPWVRLWLVWNEPNQRKWLRPTSPGVYVRKLLNPAYQAIHAENPRAKVAGGVTAPRGGYRGVSPVDWIRGMRAAGARLDAYAHHPYPLRRFETPWAGGCAHCKTITMASLERLLREVARAFGRKRIWLAEYGYQTNPPDRFLGVSHALQARYLSEAALRVRQAPRVDLHVHFLYRDERDIARWQSGLENRDGGAKLALRAFPLPLAQVARSGKRTTLWGQVRPRSGRQPYRLQVRRKGRWIWAGPRRWTNARGDFRRVVHAGAGSRFRIWSPRDRSFGAPLSIR